MTITKNNKLDFKKYIDIFFIKDKIKAKYQSQYLLFVNKESLIEELTTYKNKSKSGQFQQKYDQLIDLLKNNQENSIWEEKEQLFYSSLSENYSLPKISSYDQVILSEKVKKEIGLKIKEKINSLNTQELSELRNEILDFCNDKEFHKLKANHHISFIIFKEIATQLLIKEFSPDFFTYLLDKNIYSKNIFGHLVKKIKNIEDQKLFNLFLDTSLEYLKKSSEASSFFVKQLNEEQKNEYDKKVKNQEITIEEITCLSHMYVFNLEQLNLTVPNFSTYLCFEIIYNLLNQEENKKQMFLKNIFADKKNYTITIVSTNEKKFELIKQAFPKIFLSLIDTYIKNQGEFGKNAKEAFSAFVEKELFNHSIALSHKDQKVSKSVNKI